MTGICKVRESIMLKGGMENVVAICRYIESTTDEERIKRTGARI